MVRTSTFYDLKDACALSGCPVCRLRAEASDRYINDLLWESVNDPEKRQLIRRARGFCREHAWGLIRLNASLGVAIITRDVIQNLMRELSEAEFKPPALFSGRRLRSIFMPNQPAPATSSIVERLGPQAPCAVCVWVEKMELIYLDTLIEHVSGKNQEDVLLDAYQASDGLCLPHFRRALSRVPDRKVYDVLVDAQQSIWQRLVDQLSESIRKSDHRFTEERWGAESGAWIRAVAALVGASPVRGAED